MNKYFLKSEGKNSGNNKIVYWQQEQVKFAPPDNQFQKHMLYKIVEFALKLFEQFL